MSWSLLFSILRSPGRSKMASCDHTRALAKHLTEGMIVSGQLCVKVALPRGFATCLKLTCGANRMRRFIPAHVLMTRPAGKLTAAVDHAYSMAEYARVWAERASSIVDAPRTEVCQQPEAREKSHVAVALWLWVSPKRRLVKQRHLWDYVALQPAWPFESCWLVVSKCLWQDMLHQTIVERHGRVLIRSWAVIESWT